MQPILNELSLRPAQDGKSDLEQRMTQLIAVVRALFAIGARPVLRSTRDAMNSEVALDRSLARWLSDRARLREEKRFLQALLSKAPYVDELLEQHEPDDVALDFSLGDRACPGLGVAHLLEAPAVSLAGQDQCEAPEFSIRMLRIDRDGAEDESTVDVANFVEPAHVDQRKDALRARILRDVRDGDMLWERRDELFPRLDFCARVERQVKAFHGNETYFREICRHLFVLSDRLADWSGGAFDPAGIEWSPESNQTLHHSRYGPMRYIECPDGETRQFSAHSKLRSGNQRIYFLAVRETRRSFVGHVGSHLPTVLNPH